MQEIQRNYASANAMRYGALSLPLTNFVMTVTVIEDVAKNAKNLRWIFENGGGRGKNKSGLVWGEFS